MCLRNCCDEIGFEIVAKTHMRYFEEEDTMHVAISEGAEVENVELGPNITAELNDKGELIGIELINASVYLRDAILESAQAKMLRLPEASPG